MEAPPEERSEALIAACDHGTAVHTYVEYAPEEFEKALERVPEQYHEFCKQVPVKDTAQYYSSPSLREVSFCYRGETGEVQVLGRDCNRDYAGRLEELGLPQLGPMDTTGTADVVLKGYRFVEVWDTKTGKYVPKPENASQLKSLAMMVVKSLAPKAEYVLVGFQRIREDRRRKKDRVRVRDEMALLTRMDLEMHEAKLKRTLKMAQEAQEAIDRGEEPEVKEGDHCRFCPKRSVCPAKRGK